MSASPHVADRARAPFLRWFNVCLRGIHLASVILLGASLLGAPLDGNVGAAAVALSGLAMLALDIWKDPGHLRKVSGASVLIKLVIVAWMAIDSSSRTYLFWLVVIGSAIFAHAPSGFRHATLFAAKEPR